EALLGINSTFLYVNPEDRERGHRARDAAGITRDFHVELRTNEGGTVWVRMNDRALRDGDNEYWEGTIADINNHSRAVEAYRRGGRELAGASDGALKKLPVESTEVGTTMIRPVGLSGATARSRSLIRANAISATSPCTDPNEPWRLTRCPTGITLGATIVK